MGSNPTKGALPFFSLTLFFQILKKSLVQLFFASNQKMILVNIEQYQITHICANSQQDPKKMRHPSSYCTPAYFASNRSGESDESPRPHSNFFVNLYLRHVLESKGWKLESTEYVTTIRIFSGCTRYFWITM